MDKIKDIILLGATGSIGKQTIEICLANDIKINAIAFNNNYEEAIKIIEQVKPKFVCTSSEKSFAIIKDKYPNLKIKLGDEGFKEIVNYSSNVVNAITGIAGLMPTVYAINKCKNLFLANKETLVVAGDLIKKDIKKNKVSLYPIDSEHDAIYRLIYRDNNLNNENNKSNISKLIITASGGKYFTKTRNELDGITPENALVHPNWSMGSKITIDSQTMVNKGLEVIEAHYLFDIDYDKIETIIHPESIIHSMVEFNDGSVEAVLYKPSMLLPIQNALLHRYERITNGKRIDFNTLSKLTFHKTDFERFPAVKFAYEVGQKGGFYPTIYNASNEACVSLFISGIIEFKDIDMTIIKMVNTIPNMKINNINIMELDYNYDNILLVHNFVLNKVKEVYK